MGQKVHPLVLRLGINKNWESRWFANKHQFADNLQEDIKIRRHIKKKFYQAAVAHIIIERLTTKTRIRIRSARPGMIIGRRGSDIEQLRGELEDITKKEISIDIEEIKNTFIEAQLVAENISLQLEKRIAFRRAMKRSIEQSMNAGAKGIKVICSGRLGGHEMSRQESYKRGKIPLQTFRADIDYGFTEANTTYGAIGVKVWLYKGDSLLKTKEDEKTI
ncbi:30S ribosomal protein S3 [Candidatus Omnitrophota bacterium]